MHARHDPIHIEEYRFVFASKYTLLWFHIIISLYLSFFLSLSHLYRSSLYTLSGRTACIWRTLNKVWPAGGVSPFKLLKHNISSFIAEKTCAWNSLSNESQVVRGGKQICWLSSSWFHKTVRYSIGKYLKNTVHWDSVGLCCVAMPPRYWCRLHVRVHTQLMYTHIHTHAHLHLSIPSTTAMSTNHKTTYRIIFSRVQKCHKHVF